MVLTLEEVADVVVLVSLVMEKGAGAVLASAAERGRLARIMAVRGVRSGGRYSFSHVRRSARVSSTVPWACVAWMAAAELMIVSSVVPVDESGTLVPVVAEGLVSVVITVAPSVCTSGAMLDHEASPPGPTLAAVLGSNPASGSV